MTPIGYVSLVLAETPWWAFVVLIVLVILGLRRLTPQVRPLASAFIAPIVFFVWGLFNTQAYGQAQAPILAWSILTTMLVLGWLSSIVAPSDTATLQSDGRFLFSGTPEPLATYLAVFAIRFGLEVWAGFQPSDYPLTGGLAIGVSALVAGRTAGRAYMLIAVKRAAMTP